MQIPNMSNMAEHSADGIILESCVYDGQLGTEYEGSGFTHIHLYHIR